MASLGCRIGRVLPRINRVTRGSLIAIPRPSTVKVNQTNVRCLVTTPTTNIQAQVIQEEDKVEPELATKSAAEENLDRLLYKMDNEMRRFARVHPAELDYIINTVKRSRFITSTQAQLLLKACGKSLVEETKEQRTKRVEAMIPLVKSYLKLDVSHYNIILKIHLENENLVNGSEFLAEMEEGGVIPNRVTFQHLIGMYCLEGNITGATTILEHMKEEEMAINENVFHSLLMGHCINRDKESVMETLQVMENSGLMPGAETYTVILTSLAKARDWESVEEFLVEAVNKDVQLDAGDYFKVIIALCENGMAEQAKGIVPRVPKKTGYFQEMRTALPQLILAGNVDLAFSIFYEFKIPSSEGQSVMNANHGIFLARPLANSGISPEICAEYLTGMVEKGYTEILILYISECLEKGDVQRIKALGKDLREMIGTESFSKFDSRFIRRQMNNKTNEEVQGVLEAMRELGLRVDTGGVSRDLINRNLDLDSQLPGNLIHQLKREVPMISYTQLNNNIIAELLNRADPRYLKACVGFMLNSKIDQVIPGFWNRALVHSYRRSDSLDDFISILFVSKTKLKENALEMSTLYNALLQLTPEELVTVLDEIISCKLGIPKDVANNLAESFKEQDVKGKLETAVLDFESDYWTPVQEQSFLESRKNKLKRAMKNAGYSNPVNESRMYTGYFDIPSDLEEMIKIKNILAKRNTFNPKLADKMIQALAENDKVELALAELAEAQAREEAFFLNPVTGNNLIQSIIRSNDLEKAVKVFHEDTKDTFYSTYTEIMTAYAKQGAHEKVLELLETKTEKKLINSSIDNLRQLINHYVEAGDVENLNNLINKIQETREDSRKYKLFLLGPLVKVHLVRDDVAGAVSAFEQICNKHKCLPAKMDLTKRLVQDENVDDLQKIIDLSIQVIGEEKSLYDLTLVFLQQGRRAQAKKMLETPGLMYNHKSMTNIMETFVKNKELDCLEDLVRLTKNLFGCDRDYMYLTWVKAVSKNAQKVNDIWLQIQEEGHAPSMQLKTEIARALQAGQLEIPFVTTDLNLEGERTVKSSATTAKETRKPAVKKMRVETIPVAPATPVSRAIQANDIDELIQLLKVETNPDVLRSGLDHLLQQDKQTEVRELIKNHQFKNVRGPLVGLLIRMFSANKDSALTFVNEIPVETRKALKTDQIMRDIFLKSGDIETYFQCSNSPQRISYKKISYLFQNETLKKKVEVMASEGSAPARALLGRFCSGSGDKEGLVKYWSQDTREDRLEVARDFIVDIDSLEKLRWAYEALNNDSSVLRIACNQCLSVNRENTKEILDYAVKSGLSLESINTKSLKIVSEMKDFHLREDAKRIVEERGREEK